MARLAIPLSLALFVIFFWAVTIGPSIILFLAAVLVVVAPLLSKNERPKFEKNGEVLVDYSERLELLVIGMGVFVLFLAIFYGLIGQKYDPVEEALGLGFVAILMTACVLPLVLEFHFTWYSVDNEGIVKHALWRKSRTIRWSDVASIEVGSWGLAIKGNGIRILGLSNLLANHAYIALGIKRNVDPSKYHAAQKIIEEWASQAPRTGSSIGDT